MSAVVHGLIGGAIAALLTAYIASRAALRGERGVLRFGPFMWCLGIACLAFAAFPIVITFGFGHEKEFLAKVALFGAFLSGGIYCIGEAAFVTGRFDEKGIEFRTPWTGAKRELWRDLVAVRFNDVAGWYTLTFRDGKKVRLSRFLLGHGLALEAASSGGEF
ncbi:MAG: PH domain-containing protein [Lysobacterales bacterium]|jgi:hypothetical protein